MIKQECDVTTFQIFKNNIAVLILRQITILHWLYIPKLCFSSLLLTTEQKSSLVSTGVVTSGKDFGQSGIQLFALCKVGIRSNNKSSKQLSCSICDSSPRPFKLVNYLLIIMYVNGLRFNSMIVQLIQRGLHVLLLLPSKHY